MCEDGATVAATYLLFGETVRAGLVRAERAAILHGDNFTGNPHKIPLMSYLRYETPAIFRLKLIGPPKQMKQMKQKCSRV